MCVISVLTVSTPQVPVFFSTVVHFGTCSGWLPPAVELVKALPKIPSGHQGFQWQICHNLNFFTPNLYLRLTRKFLTWLSFIISPTFVTGPTTHSGEHSRNQSGEAALHSTHTPLQWAWPRSSAPFLCRFRASVFPMSQRRHSSPPTHLVHLLEGPALILIYPLSYFWKIIIRWNFLPPQHEPAALYFPSSCDGWFLLVCALLLTFKSILFKSSPFLFHPLTLSVSCGIFPLVLNMI